MEGLQTHHLDGIGTSARGCVCEVVQTRIGEPESGEGSSQPSAGTTLLQVL
jgi:hypothetical protein